MTYTVRFQNHLTGEALTIMQFERQRFTMREYRIVLSELFFLAAVSKDNRSLTADVFCSSDPESLDTILSRPEGERGLLSLECTTTTDGSTITAHITMNGQPIRHMIVAA